MGEYDSQQVSELDYVGGKIPVLDSVDSDRVYDDLNFIDDNSLEGALVAVHGFNPDETQHPEARSPEEVWDDRFTKASEVAFQLEKRGSLEKILISGGGDFDGRSEAEIMYEWAQKDGHPITFFSDYVEMEEYSEDTEENVLNIYEEAFNDGIDEIVAVSSFDHIGRVMDDFETYMPEDNSFEIYPVPSDESYRRTERLVRDGFHMEDSIDYSFENVSDSFPGR